jgi:hypothetical protein
MAVQLKNIPRGILEFTGDWEKFRADAPKKGADLRSLGKAALLTQSFRGFGTAVQQFDAKYLLLQKLMTELQRNAKPAYVDEAKKQGKDLTARCALLLGQSEDLAKLLKEVDKGLLALINAHYKKKTPADAKLAESLRIPYQQVLGPLRSLAEQAQDEFSRIAKELAQGLVDLERWPEPKLDDDHILCPHCKRALSIKEARKKMSARA